MLTALPVWKQSSHTLGRGFVHDQHSVKLPLDPRSLLPPKVTLHAFGMHDLACGGDLETPLCALMRFEFDLVAHCR